MSCNLGKVKRTKTSRSFTAYLPIWMKLYIAKMGFKPGHGVYVLYLILT